MKTLNNKPVLVLGGKGKTGSRVVARLQDHGYDVRVASRSTEPRFDWTDRDTWAEVLQGVGALYITYQPDLAVPGAVADIEHLVELAAQADVRRMVLLTGRGEDEAQRAELVLQHSTADWTIVRAGWFAQNFSEDFFFEGVRAGQVVVPKSSIKEPFVDVDDIADVVVAALMDDRHIGQIYEVTGPRLLSFADTVAEIGAACGRDIQLIEVSTAEYKQALEEQGLPDDFVWLVTYLFGEVLDGRNAYLSDGVERALGRQPKDFSDYARAVAATGAWAA